MNKLLADGLSALNLVIAIAIVVAGAFAGHVWLGHTVLGLVVGGVAAVLFCGVLAMFLDMRAELIEIRGAAATHNDGLAAVSKQLGTIHQLLAERGAPSSSVPLAWCASCGQRRMADSVRCVWCGSESEAVASRPNVGAHAA